MIELVLVLLAGFWFLYQLGSLFESNQTGPLEDILEEKFEDTFVGDILVSADDMKRLSDSGYDSSDVEFMESDDLKNAMEDAGINTSTYDFEEQYEDTFVGNNLVSADDMELLSNAGYDSIDVEFMEPDELRNAMEDAGVDTYMYDFED